MSALAAFLRELTLLQPLWLLLALLPPIALLARRRRPEPGIAFAPMALLPVRRGWRARIAALPCWLDRAALLLVVVALARPVRSEPLPPRKRGVDLMLCLDASSSMTADDLDRRRTRFEVAKDAAARFMAARPDDRIGLIAFARFPDVRCPPTLDRRALAATLAATTMVEADGPEDATGIGTAVARAAQALRNGAAKSRVVVVLTDGAENVATAQAPDEIAPLHAAQLARELGVRVHVIVAGIGSPDGRGGFAPLDTRQARRLAEVTGGRYFTARDAAAIEAIYAEIDALEKSDLAAPRLRIVEEFLPFLAAALALLFAGRLLRATLLEALP